MTNDELIELFKKYRNGDRKSGDIIAEYGLKLLKYTVKNHYDYDLIKKDDLYSVGTVGLVKAINSYDLDKNIHFSTYAYRCILIEIMHYYRKERVKTVGFDDYTFIGQYGEKLPYAKEKLTEEDFSEKFVNREYVNHLLGALNDKERDLIEMYFGLGKYNTPVNQGQIAQKYNVSKQYISKCIIKILNDLRHCAENEEYMNIRKLRK